MGFFLHFSLLHFSQFFYIREKMPKIYYFSSFFVAKIDSEINFYDQMIDCLKKYLNVVEPAIL